MINTKTTKKIMIYAPIKVADTLEKVAGDKTSVSSLCAEILTDWLVKNKHIKTVKVEVPDL